ncbi:unnamed protein product [Nesidiocoris tenuis]|uniref:Uncharacterized protein n=1 Tax=Nesidiocoris tenuis TaxID=355587 RepID=A0A6H5G3J1_9HEMI|nr:unnamed protein product [Nesidiocoris tenuis]
MVCEEDFVYMNDDEFNKTNVQFKSGKSLLFALPSLVDGCPDLGRIHVWVTRRVGRTDQTKKMGSAEICLTGSFENLLVAAAHQQSDAGPVSKFIKYVLTYLV